MIAAALDDSVRNHMNHDQMRLMHNLFGMHSKTHATNETNLRHLEYLLAVADTGSFSRAAERCHITQSALSRSIQTLEDDLGARLIDRMGKRNELTPFGQIVCSRARRMVLDAVELKRSAQLLQDGLRGSFALGSARGLLHC